MNIFCIYFVFVDNEETTAREGGGGEELARRGKNNISLATTNATVPTFVEDNKAYSRNGNSPKRRRGWFYVEVEEMALPRQSYQCICSSAAILSMSPWRGRGQSGWFRILGEDRGFRFPRGGPT
jgi:hypothetical protein